MKTYLTFLLSSVLILNVTHSISQINFEENAVKLGCSNTSYGVGTLGGGISFYDFDNDGWDDITISSEEDKPVRFFKNYQGTFSEIELELDDPLYETKTVQWVDFDNDGDNDLFVTSHTNGNILYRNIGNFNFENITQQSGLNTENNKTYGASWGDYNNDGFLDVFMAARFGVLGNTLHKNNGDGTFTNVSNDAGILEGDFISFCSAFFDFDNDGWQDIIVANDRNITENHLYHNNGDGSFTEIGASAGVNFAIDAMSTTIGDFNKDGWMDFYVTNNVEGNAFFRNNGDGTFTDVAEFNGTLMESFCWGAVFIDGDNDADIDLYVSAIAHNNPNLLPAAFFINDGNGNFSIPEDENFMIEDNAPSFANALGDINNDGYPDITVLNYNPDDIFVWQNTSSQANNWLKIKLQGEESNKQGVGSVIEIAVNGLKQYNYTLLGEGFLGQNSGFEFFGIGEATSIDYIKVTWLSGVVDIIENPEINTQNLLVEGSNTLSSLIPLADESITVLPNPVLESFNIRLKNNINQNAIFSLKDVNGRNLREGKITNHNKMVNIDDLSSGLYLLQIILNNKVYQKKIIKK